MRVALVLLLSLPSAARAEEVERRSVELITLESEVIVRGRVARAEPSAGCSFHREHASGAGGARHAKKRYRRVS